jgi:hypothetical protein
LPSNCLRAHDRSRSDTLHWSPHENNQEHDQPWVTSAYDAIQHAYDNVQLLPSYEKVNIESCQPEGGFSLGLYLARGKPSSRGFLQLIKRKVQKIHKMFN